MNTTNTNTNYASNSDVQFTTATPASSALVVSLSIGTWSASARDKRKGDELTMQAGAKSGVAKVRKDLMPGSKELEAVKKIERQARLYVYDSTYIWNDDRDRLLPMARYTDFVATIGGPASRGQLQRDFDDAVDVFIAVYSQQQAEAQVSLGNLYNPDDYPSVHEVRAKFRFEVDYSPVPEAGHFLVDLQQQAKEELIEQFNRRANDRVRRSFAAVCEEFKETMVHLVSKVSSVDDTAQETRIHATLLPNIRKVLERVRTANDLMGNNADVEAAAASVEALLSDVSVEGIKSSLHTRVKVRTGVNDILSKFNF